MTVFTVPGLAIVESGRGERTPWRRRVPLRTTAAPAPRAAPRALRRAKGRAGGPRGLPRAEGGGAADSERARARRDGARPDRRHLRSAHARSTRALDRAHRTPPRAYPRLRDAVPPHRRAPPAIGVNPLAVCLRAGSRHDVQPEFTMIRITQRPQNMADSAESRRGWRVGVDIGGMLVAVDQIDERHGLRGGEGQVAAGRWMRLPSRSMRPSRRPLPSGTSPSRTDLNVSGSTGPSRPSRSAPRPAQALAALWSGSSFA